ncbi:putative isochorismatase [Actinacidiphila reveromycinica]|uniref:Putative isochorismatase n=1 Tax=Actinacidiphila reveromycinica TaxID=659352 RepID=A0A7U3UQT3_9ACTN|nr:isochorismatase family cysteine hydrolase [Streptomyces sp. SN-593]BBA97015.1 putative isochorismatase [Streptomyces sp. SN-593]
MPQQALLVMDVQRTIVERYADASYVTALADTVRAARAAGVPVVYVVVDFRPGYPEISPRNKMFGGLPARSAGARPDNGVHPGVAPQEGDPVVVKRRVSAFAGSDLELLLRAMEVDHLVLSGIATSGVVLSTLRQAADLDYRVTVLSDRCVDADPLVHDVLLTRVFPTQAEVTPADSWQRTL